MSDLYSNSTCFVCGRPVDRDGLDIITDPACRNCVGRTVLISTGAKLSTLLASTRPDPLEGSGLNGILNPVAIDGIRSWADFAAGGWAVFREHHPSRDWFDFVVQHRKEGAAVLARIREQGLHEAPTSTLVNWLLQEVRAARVSSLSPVARVIGWWGLVSAGKAAIAAAGPIRTNEDAWAAAMALKASRFSPSESEMEEIAQRLQALAKGA